MNSTNNSNGQTQQDNIGFAPLAPEITESPTAVKAAAENQDFASTWLGKAEECGITKAEAEFLLAECYSKGIGVEKNPEQAFAWYKKSADQGYRQSKFFLARYYKMGRGVAQSDEMADTVLEEYLDSDMPYDTYSKAIRDAYIALGDLYAEGIEVEHSDDFAFILYEWAYMLCDWADEGATEDTKDKALDRLGVSCLEGQTTQFEYAAGIDYIRWASENKQSATFALLKQRSLKLLFPELEDKEEIEQFHQYAFDWCKNELEQQPNTFEALLCAGILALFGKGSERNDELAKKYFDEIEHFADEEISNPQKVKAVSSLLNAIYFEASIPPQHLDWACGDFENGLSILRNGRIYQDEPFFPALILDFCIENSEHELAKKYLNDTSKDAEIIYWGDKDADKASLLRTLKNVYKSFSEKSHREYEDKKRLKLKLHEKDRELEDMMSMFAHKFRSPLDAIIYNTTHDNQVKLYAEAAQTMRGLLDIFSMISTDDDILKTKIKQDSQGTGRLITVFGKTLDTVLLHLLSKSGTEKIQQHYMAYAKAHGQCDEQVGYKTWCEDYFDLEQRLQAEWEQSFAQLLNQSATLEQRLVWLEQRYFKLELIGFDRADIQFKEYGATESFLTILLNEILVNAFKYYSSASKQAVVLEWAEREGYQMLICRNPSIRSERTTIKGSHKGHTFLSALARKTGSAFTKPTPQDDFVVEFGIPDELLISK
ncbi:tetratricopeptide repeat protein [Methyloglobulus sp.]|uniref:tetratricopeptide repeat protein n=1 Tax=Methyloglobulus sp. TaxID=2518622 RepID=UPI0032B78F82